MEKTDLPFPRIFTLSALSFILGLFLNTLFGSNFASLWPLLLFLLILSLLVGFINLLLKNHLFAICSLVIFFILIGFLYCSYFDIKTKVDWPYNQPLQISGEIASKPETQTMSQRFLLRVDSLKGTEDKPNNYKGRLLILKTSSRHNLSYGDSLLVFGKIEKPAMIEEFDYQRYLKKYPLYGTVVNPQKLEKIGATKAPAKKIMGSLYLLADKMEESLNKSLPEPHASLAAGIILGQKRSLPKDFQIKLQNVGLSHIVAISGFNITIIFSALANLLIGHLQRRKIFILGTILALLFILLTGAPPSIIRAAVLSVLVLFARTIGRRGDQINILLLAAISMLIFNPFLLYYDLSFQLSYLGYLGLVYLSPLIRQFFDRSKNIFLQTWIFDSLAETLGAIIAITPLAMAIFGRVSLIAPLANLLVIWVLIFITGYAFLSAFLGLISLPLAALSTAWLWPSLEYVVRVVEYLSPLPHASIEVKKGNWLLVQMLYLFLILIIYLKNKKQRYAV